MVYDDVAPCITYSCVVRDGVIARGTYREFTMAEEMYRRAHPGYGRKSFREAVKLAANTFARECGMTHPVGSVLDGIAKSCIGKTLDDFALAIQEHEAGVRERAAAAAERERKYDSALSPVSDMIMGYKACDVSANGFSVELTMRRYREDGTDVSHEERMDYVRRHREELIGCAADSVRVDSRRMGKIGSLDYYYASELVVCRDARLVVIFDVKGDIINGLG